MDIRDWGPFAISGLSLLVTVYLAVRGRHRERAETRKLDSERKKADVETRRTTVETLQTEIEALSARVDELRDELAAYAGYTAYLLEGIRKHTRWKPVEFYEWIQTNHPDARQSGDQRFRWPGSASN